jgi:hypothetical protein
VRSRLWAAGAAAWTVAFIVLAYVKFHPQPWYVVVVAVAGLLALSAAVFGTDGRGRIALLFATGILVVAALLGGWTAGPVLLPAIVGSILAVKSSEPVSR